MTKAQIEIRRATADDLVDVQYCAHTAYAKYVGRMGGEPAPMHADFARQIMLEQVYIALTESGFAGYVVFYAVGDHLHLESVAVIPARTGRGIGKMLVSFVEQTARDRKISAVELYTNEAMTENLVMYPTLGYAEIERKQQDGFARVFYRKRL